MNLNFAPTFFSSVDDARCCADQDDADDDGQGPVLATRRGAAPGEHGEPYRAPCPGPRPYPLRRTHSLFICGPLAWRRGVARRGVARRGAAWSG